jgi:hypothetical protein
MNGKYHINTNRWLDTDKTMTHIVDKQADVDPWSDVIGVLNDSFIRFGNFIIAKEDISTITYKED